MVTDDELRQIMPRMPRARRQQYLPLLQKAMEEYEITTYLREAAFLAQLAHESAELRYMEEIASGERYEGRRDLGNTQRGDGRRYKGRGPIQLTGRANYRKYGALLGLDLENNPEIAATPEVGFRIAALFWKMRGLNELADRQEFRLITRRINGGYNGWPDRLTYYNRALMVLSKDDAETSQSAPAPTIRIANSDAKVPAYMTADGRLLVAIRPVARALGWPILSAASGECVVQDERKGNHTLAMILRDGVGFVAARDLPCSIDWDASVRVCSISRRS